MYIKKKVIVKKLSVFAFKTFLCTFHYLSIVDRCIKKYRINLYQRKNWVVAIKLRPNNILGSRKSERSRSPDLDRGLSQ